MSRCRQSRWLIPTQDRRPIGGPSTTIFLSSRPRMFHRPARPNKWQHGDRFSAAPRLQTGTCVKRYKANMRIEVTREACCSQDDQLGPLTLQIELAEESVIWELARKIGEANFLQFSSPRNVIDAYCAGKLLFSIPAVGASSASVSYAVGRDDPVHRHVRE